MPEVAVSCPCGGARYDRCCAKFIDGDALPQSAEELMRSRYTAYSMGNGDYLRATWHVSTRPQSLDLSMPQQRWLGLQVKHSTSISDEWASVEFVARWRETGPEATGRAHRLHERSRFVREAGRWFYVDGDILQG